MRKSALAASKRPVTFDSVKNIPSKVTASGERACSNCAIAARRAASSEPYNAARYSASVVGAVGKGETEPTAGTQAAKHSEKKRIQNVGTSFI